MPSKGHFLAMEAAISIIHVPVVAMTAAAALESFDFVDLVLAAE